MWHRLVRDDTRVQNKWWDENTLTSPTAVENESTSVFESWSGGFSVASRSKKKNRADTTEESLSWKHVMSLSQGLNPATTFICLCSSTRDVFVVLRGYKAKEMSHTHTCDTHTRTRTGMCVCVCMCAWWCAFAILSKIKNYGRQFQALRHPPGLESLYIIQNKRARRTSRRTHPSTHYDPPMTLLLLLPPNTCDE